jgi:hypothetical protein
VPERGEPAAPRDETLVRAALRLAGIDPPEEEIAALAAMVAPSRAAVESLYAMPGILNAEPATTFTPPLD